MNYNPQDKYYKKLKAAYMIYSEHRTQQEVAEILNISRPTLARYMDEAFEEGIVTIEVHDVRNEYVLLELETKLKQKYQLLDAVIVECPASSDEQAFLDAIGTAAAHYFEAILRDNCSVGISWGKTIEAFSTHLAGRKPVRNFEVVSLVGGSLYWDSKYHSNTISQRVLDKYPGKGYFLYAPTFASSQEQYDILVSNSEVQTVLNQAKKVDIAVVGIGGQFSQYTELAKQLNGVSLDASQLDTRLFGINSQFLTVDGRYWTRKTLRSEDRDLQTIAQLNDLFIGLRLDDLKKIPKIMALAGGPTKHEATRAALLGGYANILITDKETAEYLLNT